MRRISAIVILLAASAATRVAFAQASVTGERVEFDPPRSAAGGTMKVNVVFTVAHAPASVTPVFRIMGVPAPPPPSIAAPPWPVGTHTAEAGVYRVPISPPERVCFNILTGTTLLIRNVCLRRVADSRSGLALEKDPEHPGWGLTIHFSRPALPVAVPPSERPDLRILAPAPLLPGATQVTLSIENIGRSAANTVRIDRECLIDGSWARSGRLEPIPLLEAARSLVLHEELPDCPWRTTRFRFKADPGNEIAELNEDNNTVEVPYAPDFRVSRFAAMVAPSRSGDTVIRFEISNTGNRSVSLLSYEVSVLRDGAWRSFLGENISFLPGQLRTEKTIHVWASRHGLRPNDRLRLRVDPLDQYAESDETNNSSETTLVRP